MTETSSSSATDLTTARSNRSWPRFILWLVIFLSGVIVGGGTTLLVVRNNVLASIHHPEDMPARLARHLQRMLDLDAQQVQRVEQIFRDRQQALQALRREFQPKIEKELDRVNEEVSTVLRDDQRDKWRSRFRTLRNRWMPALPAGKLIPDA
jgi:hypothetical protein